MSMSICRLASPAILAALACAGCADNAPPNKVSVAGTATQTRLRGAHHLYSAFQAKEGRAPKDLVELNGFGKSLPTDQGGPVHLSDEFLISPRDQKPIEIRFGLVKRNDGADQILAHEREGVSGRRLVVFLDSGVVEDVPETRFQQLSR